MEIHTDFLFILYFSVKLFSLYNIQMRRKYIIPILRERTTRELSKLKLESHEEEKQTNERVGRI